MLSDPELQLLAEADPAGNITMSPIESHHFLRSTLDASRPASDMVAISARRQRSRAVRVGIGALAIGAAVPTLAFAANFLARTGMFNRPGGENGPGTSEMIDLLASDYVDYAVTLWPDHVTLPTSFDTKEFARTVAQATHDQEVANEAAWFEEHDAEEVYGSLMAADGVKFAFEEAARCVWLSQWLAADSRGDIAAAEEAATLLDEATTWTYTVVFYDDATMTNEKQTVAAARAGDRGTVQDAAGFCPAYTLAPEGGR